MNWMNPQGNAKSMMNEKNFASRTKMWIVQESKDVLLISDLPKKVFSLFCSILSNEWKLVAKKFIMGILRNFRYVHNYKTDLLKCSRLLLQNKLTEQHVPTRSPKNNNNYSSWQIIKASNKSSRPATVTELKIYEVSARIMNPILLQTCLHPSSSNIKTKSASPPITINQVVIGISTTTTQVCVCSFFKSRDNNGRKSMARNAMRLSETGNSDKHRSFPAAESAGTDSKERNCWYSNERKAMKRENLVWVSVGMDVKIRINTCIVQFASFERLININIVAGPPRRQPNLAELSVNHLEPRNDHVLFNCFCNSRGWGLFYCIAFIFRRLMFGVSIVCEIKIFRDCSAEEIPSCGYLYRVPQTANIV